MRSGSTEVARMAVRGRVRFLHSALWAGAGLFLTLVGLFMSLHESAAHDACVGLARGIHERTGQTGLDCGFTDTVYWAGIVILAAGALSTIATVGSVHIGRDNVSTCKRSLDPSDGRVEGHRPGP